VGCLGDDFNEALLKALLSVGFRFPLKKALLSTGSLEKKVNFINSAKLLHKMGVHLYATPGTHEFLQEYNVPSEKVVWPGRDGGPDVMDVLANEKLDLVVNIPKNFQEDELTNDYKIRREAVDLAIPLITNLQLAKRLTEALSAKPLDELKIKSWDEY
ncbi:MAG: carbamoyl-phosphate synthase large subunit, partial [bacterium]